MTLDKAIKHAEEVADKKEQEKQKWERWLEHDNDNRAVAEKESCELCAKEHRQLAEWLKELKQLRERTRWIPISEELPTDNGWYQCTVALDDLSITMDLYYKNGKWLDNRRINMFDTYDIYGYGHTTEKHKLSYQELISEFDWTVNVTAWKPLSQPYKEESEGKS